MTPRFLLAFAETVGHEGVLSLDPKDRGNWTSGKIGVGELKGSKYGISAMSYPHLDIRNLTLEQAQRIYWTDFWGKARCDAMPPPVDELVFDAAVNHGVANGIRLLQKACGVVDDGDWGPASQAALERHMRNPAKLAGLFIGHRLLFWAAMQAFDSQGRGWTRRGARELLDALEEVI